MGGGEKFSPHQSPITASPQVHPHHHKPIRITTSPSASSQARPHHHKSIRIITSPPASSQAHPHHHKPTRIITSPSASSQAHPHHHKSIRITTSPPASIKMSSQDVDSYVTHLPEFKVVVCDFCKECIPPDVPVRHYELNHTATSAHPIPTEIRHKIRDYMATLDLYDPKMVISPNRFIPQLKIIGKGLVCKFPGCGACRTSPQSMRTHYYTHKDSISNDFKDWEETSFQSFFVGRHKK